MKPPIQRPSNGDWPQEPGGHRHAARQELTAVSWLIVLSGLILCSCAPYYHYKASYDLQLVAVEPAGQIAQSRDSVHTVFDYHDKRLHVEWAIDSTAQLDFVLDNLTADTVRLRWDQVRFLDERRNPHEVLHAGMRPGARFLHRYDSIIPPFGKTVDFILPLHETATDSGRTVVLATQDQLISSRSRTAAEARQELKLLRHRTIQVVMPIHITGPDKVYRFSFQIENLVIY